MLILIVINIITEYLVCLVNIQRHRFSKWIIYVDYITDNGDFNAVKSVSFNINQRFSVWPANQGAEKVPSRLPLTVYTSRPLSSPGGKIIFNGQDLLGLSDDHLNTLLRWSRNRHGFPKCDELTPIPFFLFKSNSLMFASSQRDDRQTQAKDRAEKAARPCKHSSPPSHRISTSV